MFINMMKTPKCETRWDNLVLRAIVFTLPLIGSSTSSGLLGHLVGGLIIWLCPLLNVISLIVQVLIVPRMMIKST